MGKKKEREGEKFQKVLQNIYCNNLLDCFKFQS